MIRLLQISDIHFNETSGDDDKYAQMKCKFLEDIADCQSKKGKIDYVLICGDIAFSGFETQYKEANVFIEKICEITECEKNNVFVVPGNHDKKRDVYSHTRSLLREPLQNVKNTNKLIESRMKEPMAIVLLYAPFMQYYTFASNYSCISDIASKASAFSESGQGMVSLPKFDAYDKMFWSEQIRDIQGIPVFIHGSNSSILSDNYDDEHMQVLPLQAYNVTTSRKQIHIFMLHHPMNKITEGDKIERIIDSRFQLQLYGHMHNQSSSDNGAIKIYSGALQPSEADEASKYFPIYNILEMDVAEDNGSLFLKVDVYCRKWDGTKFIEYMEETKLGENALKVELPQNDEWAKTIERLKKGETIPEEQNETNPVVYPHAVKYNFLHSKQEKRIIKAMYNDRFDNISPNRIKYLTFLKQVEADGRINELNNNLRRYGK